MVNEAKLDPHSFDQAYAVLKRNADFLSQQQESSIDALLPLVEESMQAYQICKMRLEAIEQALERHWQARPPDPVAVRQKRDREVTRYGLSCPPTAVTRIRR